MLARLRREYWQLVTSGAQLTLLAVGLQFRSPGAWLVCLALIALISVFAWLSALRRLRAVRDTPTSRIASAAQGYVELVGRGRPYPGASLVSRKTGLPCLWYRYKIARRTDNNKLELVDEGESNDFFMLDDGSGCCVVDPSGADILTMHEETWARDDYVYTEWKLLDIDTLYVIGRFRTFGGSSTDATVSEEVKNVLAEWKRDMPDLHKRFDLNNDGELDMTEWMLARKAARREADKRIAAERAQPDVHYLMQPEDGRLFLISNVPQNKLARRYRLWVWAHLAIFLGALASMAWLLSEVPSA